jgi:hypothetical protein
MFTPPNKAAAGVLQFRQYIRWVESVTDCALLDGPADEDDVAEHRRIAGARLVCDRLRDGVILNVLLSRVEESVGHMPGHAPPASKGGVQDAARLLAQARRRFAAVMTSNDLSSMTRFSGIALPYCIHSDADVPPVEALYGGNYEALSSLLFHMFHVSVVRERFRRAPSMVQWYRQVASNYDMEFPVPVTCDCDGKVFDAAFRDGLVWIFAIHNTIGEDVDLSSVYRYPSTPEQLAANLSFAYCLMELHDIFSYFPVLDDLLERRNNHFLFMQSFHLYQRLETVALRPIEVARLRFAPQVIARTDAHAALKPRAAQKVPRYEEHPVRLTAAGTPKRRVQSPAASRTGPRPSSTSATTQNMPTPRAQAAPAPHPQALSASVMGGIPQPSPPPSPAFECKIACGPSSALQMTSTLTTIVPETKIIEIQIGNTMYVLPSLAQRGCGCRRGRGATVSVTFSVPAPHAPPPYQVSCAPALTLFFADAPQADAFVAAASS